MKMRGASNLPHTSRAGRNGAAISHEANRFSPLLRAPAGGRSARRTSPHGLRIAAIDIGTNSLHMVVVEVTAQLSFKTLSSEKELTQLGTAALVQHRLTRRAMAHTLEVLGR